MGRSVYPAWFAGFACVAASASVSDAEVTAPPAPKAVTGVSPKAMAHGGDAVGEAGRKVYQRYCIGCHGEKGDGKGPAAKFLDPKPRDFTKGVFKFGAVPAGKLPTDDDLMRTVTNGLSASSMPSWRLLPQDQRWAVIQYLKSFSPRWKKDKPGPALSVPEDPFNEEPPSKLPSIRAQGEKIYHGRTTCWGCHPAYVPNDRVTSYVQAYGKSETPRAEMSKAEGKFSEPYEAIVMPPDFVKRRLKTGHSLEALARVIWAGVGGTAMPTWKGQLKDDEFWAMVYYVRGLVEQRLAKNKSVIPLPKYPQPKDR
ncbi:MAG: c-type cytochrome [Deltaproteobacteria bacterium]|nr:c-type cytochrome [Deltaproteobacteria bacterium]